MQQPDQQTKAKIADNPPLRRFIIIGLMAAAVLVISVLLFGAKSQPPAVALCPDCQVVSTNNDGTEYETDLQSGSTLSLVVAFYNKDFTDKGWTKLSNTVSTADHYTAVFESGDQQWATTFDVDYQVARSIASIYIYQRRLGN